MPGYTTTSVLHHPPVPDVAMFDILNERVPSQASAFPSPFQSPTNINHDKSNSDGNNNSDTNGNYHDESGSDYGEDRDDAMSDCENTDGDYDEMEYEVGEDSADQSLGMVFHRSSQPAATMVDPDTESETSDEEGEPQLRPTSRPSPSGPEDSEQPRLSGIQPGKCLCAGISLFLMTSGVQHDKKPVVVKFGRRAGEGKQASPGHAGYTGYSRVLSSEDSVADEWAPFSTRTEWEIARWAKLRGPSSTALSELLKINGVS
jgi:hypothetical protein